MNHHLILPGNPLKQWKASLTVPIVSILLLFSSCSQKEHFEGTVLHGKITNYTGGKLTLKALNGFERNIPVDNQGRVKDSFLVDEGLYYLSFSGNFPFVYVTKGSKIEFSVDAKYFDESMVFSGDYADLNNYYLDKMERETGFKVNGKEHYGLDGTGFLDLVNTFQKEQLGRLDRLTDLPEGVKNWKTGPLPITSSLSSIAIGNITPMDLSVMGTALNRPLRRNLGNWTMNGQMIFSIPLITTRSFLSSSWPM